MKRMAFFVEGQTEQIFVNRLVRYMLGPKNTNIIQRKLRGGTNAPRQEITRHISLARRPDYEVLIIDCGADNRVKSEMLENLENLHEHNYLYLVGLRDLYPLPLDELDGLSRGLRFLPPRLKNKVQRFEVVIAVREIETWILSEKTHFQKIDKRLTPEFIKQKLGFNIADLNPVDRIHPAADLDKIYKLIGQAYGKKFNQTTKIIHSLDIKQIMGPLRSKIPGLNTLITVIEDFRALVDDDTTDAEDDYEIINIQ